MDKKSSLPLVSVVVTTRNEEKNIHRCLESIKKQAYPRDKIEVIVVDNGSSDGTKKIALEYTKKIYDKGPERSAQRNYGARMSAGKYYMFLDADMILSPGVIKESVNTLEKETDTVGLYIPEIVMGDSFWSKVRRFERSFYDATVIDCVRFVNMKIFKKVGGFDESMSGPEDWDLDKKIRMEGKVKLIREPLFHNETNFSLFTYLIKKKYYVKSFDSYLNKWGRSDEDVKKQFGIFYRYIFVFTENGKWKKLLMHPVLSLSMLFLRFLVGATYAFSKI